MALKKNLLLMGFATAVRLIAGLLTFSIVARLLGPESFGVLMLWFSVSALLSLCTNFGLTTYVLREIGADPGAAESIINEGLTGKLLLAVLVFACAGVAAWGFEIEFKQVFLYLLVASVADTFSEFLNAGLRARDRFDVETRLATITSLTHAAIVVTAVWVSPKIEVAAAAYALSRLVALAITVPAITKNFAAPKLAAIGVSLTRLRKATSYAVDFGFQSLFGQVDSVVLNHFLGPVAVGLYQAGMRIFQAGIQAATVLSNVFLPRAAALRLTPDSFTSENRRIQFSFISVGLFFGLLMVIFSRQIVGSLFGSTYLLLVDFMPLLGFLFFLRFTAGAWGVVLTASGQQYYRTIIGIIHWLVVLGFAYFIVPLFGIRGWLASLCIGSIFMTVSYAFRGKRFLNKYWDVTSFSIVGGLLFFPFIRSN